MINLLPKDYKEAIHKEMKIRAVSSWFFLVSIVFIFLSIISFPTFFLQKTQKDIIQKQNSNINTNTGESSPEELLADINEINNLVSDTLLKLELIGVSADTFKVALSRDSDLTKIKQIYLENQETDILLQIVGVATTREALLDYSTSLKTSGVCQNFPTPVSSLTKSQDIDFSIDCRINK